MYQRKNVRLQEWIIHSQIRDRSCEGSRNSGTRSFYHPHQRYKIDAVKGIRKFEELRFEKSGVLGRCESPLDFESPEAPRVAGPGTACLEPRRSAARSAALPARTTPLESRLVYPRRETRRVVRP